MKGRRVIEAVVGRVAPNATVVEVVEDETRYSVMIAGTTGATARCDVPREAVDAADAADEARTRLETMLKQCADTTVAPVPDGRW
jgi:hypothetical protein